MIQHCRHGVYSFSASKVAQGSNRSNQCYSRNTFRNTPPAVANDLNKDSYKLVRGEDRQRIAHLQRAAEQIAVPGLDRFDRRAVSPCNGPQAFRPGFTRWTTELDRASITGTFRGADRRATTVSGGLARLGLWRRFHPAWINPQRHAAHDMIGPQVIPLAQFYGGHVELVRNRRRPYPCGVPGSGSTCPWRPLNAPQRE